MKAFIQKYLNYLKARFQATDELLALADEVIRQSEEELREKKAA